MSKKLRDHINKRNVNLIFLVGEVVDMGVEAHDNFYVVRARLKVSAGKSYAYVDCFGKSECRDTMALVCQTGNIVYVEGEFRCKAHDNITATPYILVTRIDCLLRHKKIKPPSTSIIRLLDSLDPFGYEEEK